MSFTFLFMAGGREGGGGVRYKPIEKAVKSDRKHRLFLLFLEILNYFTIFGWLPLLKYHQLYEDVKVQYQNSTFYLMQEKF